MSIEKMPPKDPDMGHFLSLMRGVWPVVIGGISGIVVQAL